MDDWTVNSDRPNFDPDQSVLVTAPIFQAHPRGVPNCSLFKERR
jgi:hypothetical protein